ncbi:hypothetical protein [Streptomyces sp. NPDC003487]
MVTSAAAGDNPWARTRRRLAAAAHPRPPRSPWRARALTQLAHLDVQLAREEAKPPSEDRRVLIEGTRAHLRAAGAAAHETFGWRRPWSGSTAREGVWSNLRTAEVLLLRLVSDDEAVGRVDEVMAMAERHLDRRDPRRARLAKRLRPILAGEMTPSDRELMAGTLDSSYKALDAELARVRSLRNILWAATFAVLIGVACLAIYGWVFPQSLSLCFAPRNGPVGSDTIDIVCPSADYKGRSPSVVPSDLAQPQDILCVEIAGLAGAALTVIASLRRIRGTSAPYMLPLASTVLKFPTGALSGFLGVLLIRGAFVPGLSDLDSRAQVLAWAAVFGAAQQVVTRLVDDRAQMTLSEVGHPTAAPSGARTGAAPDDDLGEAPDGRAAPGAGGAVN